LLHIPMGMWSVFTGTVDFVVRVDKKLWVGSGLLKNCSSLFSKQGAVFGASSESFDYTDWVALPVIPPRQLTGGEFASWNWIANKWLACESDFSPSLT